VRDKRDVHARVHARDRGLRRLKTFTGALVVATTASAAIFTGLAAQTTAARKLLRTHPRTTFTPARRGSVRRRPERIPPPPPLPSLESNTAPAAAPAAPTQPPAPSAAPPLAVSGGS